jgi:hypothetical protein
VRARNASCWPSPALRRGCGTGTSKPGAVVYSSRWKEMLGYADDEIEPHLGAWERLLHPDDKPLASRLNESVMRGRPDTRGSSASGHRNGHYVDVLSRGCPVRREPGGPVVRIVGTHFVPH